MIEIYLNESFVYNNKLWHLIWNLNLFLEYNANLSSSFYRKQKTSAYRISKVFNQSSNPIFHHLLRHIKQLVSHHPFQFDCVSLFRSSSPYIIDPFLTGNKELVALFCNMKGALSLFPDPVQVGNYFYPRFLSPIFFFFLMYQSQSVLFTARASERKKTRMRRINFSVDWRFSCMLFFLVNFSAKRRN